MAKLSRQEVLGLINQAPEGTSPEGIVAALREAGHQLEGYPDTLATSLPPGVAPPGEMFGPEATFRRTLRAAPFAAGLAGGMVGGPVGAGLAGGATQAVIEASPYGGPRTGARVPLMLPGLPPLEGLQVPAEALGRVEQAAGLQAGLELPGLALGAASRVLGRFGGRLRGRTAQKAVEKVQAVARARDIRQPLESAARVTQAAREAAGGATAQAIEKATPAAPRTTVEDIVDMVVNKRQETLKRPLDAVHRRQLEAETRKTVRRVAKEFSLGTHGGGGPGGGARLHFDFGEVNVLKRAFQRQGGNRAAYAAAERGVVLNPTLDRDIAGSLKSYTERVVPELRDLNRATQAAIREEQGVRRLQAAQPTEPVRRLRAGQQEAVARTLALQPSGESLIGFHAGLPPGVTIRAGRGAELSEGVSRVLGHPAVGQLARYSPRLAALMLALGQEEQPQEIDPEIQRRMELMGGIQ